MNPPELSEISTLADGTTNPFVPSGIAILLIQNGCVEVGKLFYTTNTFDTYIVHPENNDVLSPIALDIIRTKCPELLQREEATMLICPAHITNEMIWKT